MKLSLGSRIRERFCIGFVAIERIIRRKFILLIPRVFVRVIRRPLINLGSFLWVIPIPFIGPLGAFLKEEEDIISSKPSDI